MWVKIEICLNWIIVNMNKLHAKSLNTEMSIGKKAWALFLKFCVEETRNDFWQEEQ